MPFEEVQWVVPAAKEALEHREEIRKGMQWLKDYLLRKQSSVVFTGMPGVGKTVLFDYLMGKGYEPGYEPPGKSRSLESGAKADRGRKIALSVIPGDISRPRYDAIDKLILGKSPPDGIIHVVANGFAEIRHDDARAHLIEESGLETIEQFRSFQRDGEVEDIREVCQKIRQAQRKHRKPSWMIVAATKADLFPKELDEARKQYSPSGSGVFGDQLRELAGFVGADNFRWTSCPVCSARVQFRWKKRTVKPGIEEGERDALLARLWSEIKAHCQS
jgi:hypothetical protein